MFNGREIVCLCGSTKFKEAFKKAEKEEGLAGKIVLTVALFGHLEDFDMESQDKKNLDELHFDKIELSDVVYILNVGDYIGESTRKELNYARELGKKIKFLEDHYID